MSALAGAPEARGDALLARRIAEGDASAEEEFVRRFRPGLLAILRVRTRDAELAHDLSQDVLLSALESLRQGRLREGERLPGYVHAIARNHLANHGRRRARRPREVPLEEGHTVAAPDDTRRRETRQILARALGELDPLDRTVLKLTLLEQLKPAEISARLGLSPEAVGMRKLRATRRVAARVREWLGSTPEERHTN